MRRRDERGAILVITALVITALLLMIAIVIDLGATRSDRRDGQLAVDNAAAAAGQELGGDSDGETACKTALAYLSVTLDTTFSDAGCSTFAPVCIDTVERFITVSSGEFNVRIEHPVFADSPLMDKTSTIGASTIAPDPANDGLPCERFGVDVTTTGGSFFGGVAGQSDRTSRVHAVALSKQPDPTARIVPAFLMLERTACQAIQTLTGTGSAGGTYPDGTARPDGIFVRSNGSQPGLIHSDSDASGCSDKHVIEASQPASTLNSVYVEQLNDDEPGIISVVANERRGTGGMNVPASGGEVVSRTPVDNIYQSAITSLHGEAYAEVTATGQPPASNRYDCDGLPIGPIDPSLTTAYIDCDSASGFTLSGPTTVVFKDAVALGSAQRILLPTAATVIVRGEIAVNGAGGGNWGAFHTPVVRNFYVGGGVTVSTNGTLAVGAPAPGGVPVQNPTCSGTPLSSRFVIFSPPGDSSEALDVAGRTFFCATSVYLAGEKAASNSTYEELSIPSPARPKATPQEGGAGCTPDAPCPWVNGNPAPGARFIIQGGTVVWQAPNTSTAPLPDSVSLPAVGGIEDLALWGEGGSTDNTKKMSEVKSGTNLETTGIFFSPNGVMEFRSGNAGTTPVDAQFISRILTMRAGRFTMMPSLANAVQVPASRINNLIR